MSAPPSGGGAPIENRRQLIEYFAAGNKPRAAWRMGTEHEKFGFHKSSLKPLAYDGPDGIRAMLEGMTRFGWEPVTEGNNTIALKRDSASVTLEPGGQFELSGAPLETLHETAAENRQHIDEVNKSLAKYETVKQFAVLPKDLSVDEGELTPSLKVKRKVVEKKYAAMLDKMYEGSVADMG